MHSRLREPDSLRKPPNDFLFTGVCEAPRGDIGGERRNGVSLASDLATDLAPKLLRRDGLIGVQSIAVEHLNERLGWTLRVQHKI